MSTMYLASEVMLTSLMSQTTILSPESDKKIGCAQCSSFFNLCSLSPTPLCGRFLKLLLLCVEQPYYLQAKCIRLVPLQVRIKALAPGGTGQVE